MMDWICYTYPIDKVFYDNHEDEIENLCQKERRVNKIMKLVSKISQYQQR
jgi:hypothetical protein